MFKFNKAVAGVAKEEFECECCGTLDGQASTGCGCGAPTNSQASAGCGCGSTPVSNSSSCGSCGTPNENAKASTDSSCKSSCSGEK